MRSVWNLGRVAFGCSIAVLFAANLFGQLPVLTWHNDNARTGQNLSETILTPANVNVNSFKRLFTLAVDGKVDAQPLYVPSLTIGGAVHNVLYVATEHDSLYMFDADNGVQLKMIRVVNVGAGETPSDDRGCGHVTPEMGITATPVIDPSVGPHGTIYVVAMSKLSGTYSHKIHALDMTTLDEQFGGPYAIAATYPGNGDEKVNVSDAFQTFLPYLHKHRGSLLLSNGVIYTNWSSHCDQGPYTGWVIGYNATTLAKVSVLNVVPNGSRGGIWESGAAPAADSDGNIFLMTGNGTFDSTLTGGGFPVNSNFGNAFVKIATSGGTQTVADYFTMAGTTSESQADKDLGSGGVLLLPPLNDSNGNPRQLAVGAGKDQNIYVVDRTNMGGFHSPDSLYQKLTNVLVSGVWSSPAWFNGSLYYGPNGGVLKQFPFSNGQFSLPSTQSLHGFGYPGVTPSISANGTSNGIVWVAENTDPAVLRAYDATNLNTELYTSNQAAGGVDHFGTGNKYIVPTVVNGKVYVGTVNGVGVFGLKPVPFVINPTAGTPQKKFTGKAFPINLAATVLDSMNTPVSGALVTFSAPATGASGTFANGTITTQGTTNAFGVATATVFTANATSGDYTVTASVTGVATPANFSLTNSPPPSGGTLTGAVTSSSAAVNLTTEGTTDWEHWGEGAVNHKAAVVAQLTNYTVVGGGSTSQYSNDPRFINWSDGTPTVTGTNNKNGVFISSVGHGFSFTAPADTTVGTLIVHVGGWSSGGTLTASLSDQTALDFVDTTPTASGQYDRNYTLTYAAASAGQTLTVTWQMASGSGNVTLNAVALNKTTGPPPPPPGTVTATTGTPQNATVSTPFALPLQATVKDGSNNPEIGVTVTFTAPATGASGTFGGLATSTALTDGSGIATSPTFAANGTVGGYIVTASVSGIPTPANFSLTNNAVVVSGSLSGVGNSSTASVNLTGEGTTDWTHWGETTLTRRTGVPTRLSNYSIVGGGAVSKYNNDPRPISWTDGTPTASSANNKNGVFISSTGHGFSFTAPADTTTRTLIVHVGGWNSGGTLTAQLSDGSHVPFVDTTSTASGQYDRNYTLTYSAGAASQTLTVTWKMASGSGNVTLNAAALQ